MRGRAAGIEHYGRPAERDTDGAGPVEAERPCIPPAAACADLSRNIGCAIIRERVGQHAATLRATWGGRKGVPRRDRSPQASVAPVPACPIIELRNGMELQGAWNSRAGKAHGSPISPVAGLDQVLSASAALS